MPDPALIRTEEWLIQFCFWTPLAFLVIYTFVCPWWRTVFGRVVATLALVFIFVLLRIELILLGAIPAQEAEHADALSWFSVLCLGLAPAAFAALIWQMVRKPVREWWRWVRAREDEEDHVDPVAPDGEKLTEMSAERRQAHRDKVRANLVQLQQRDSKSGKDV